MKPTKKLRGLKFFLYSTVGVLAYTYYQSQKYYSLKKINEYDFPYLSDSGKELNRTKNLLSKYRLVEEWVYRNLSSIHHTTTYTDYDLSEVNSNTSSQRLRIRQQKSINNSLQIIDQVTQGYFQIFFWSHVNLIWRKSKAGNQYQKIQKFLDDRQKNCQQQAQMFTQQNQSLANHFVECIKQTQKSHRRIQRMLNAYLLLPEEHKPITVLKQKN